MNMPGVLNMAKFWIWQSSEYGRVLKLRALHSILNMPEYALTEFWIYLGFSMCQDSECGSQCASAWLLNMQKWHKIQSMPQYGWICLKRTWICMNMSIFDNRGGSDLYHTIHSARSLCKLMSTYWEIVIFRTASRV